MKKIVITTLCFLVGIVMYGQVGIGTPLPNASAQLDVVASDKGVLITRVALTNSTDATTITSGNIESLLVYNTATNADVVPGYHYWDGVKWVRIVTTDDAFTDTNTTNVSLAVVGDQLVLTDSDNNTVQLPLSSLQSGAETVTTLVDNTDGTYTYTSEDATETIVNTAALEPWMSQNGTQLDLTDDERATDNFENIYQLGNVGVGTPYVVGRFHVNSQDSQDVMFSRTLDPTGGNLDNDMDIDLVRTYGNTIVPSAVTEDGTRIGGIRFRPLVDDSNLGANPLEALPISASINAEIEGVPSATSAPAKLIFTTTPEGSLDDVERMVINNEGDLKFSEYPSTRDDSATTAITNVLYTDTDGNLLSAPASAISGGSSETVTTLVDNIDGTYTYTSEDATETIVNTAALEPWMSQNGTQLDLTDDERATDNFENIYQLGNVGVGTPYVVGRFHVNSQDSQDVMFSRTLDPTGGNLDNDMDIDLVRTYGNTIVPSAVTQDGTRIGGIRFRPLVDDSNLGANPLEALPISASINAEIEGVPSATSAPAKLIFTTTPEGSLDDVERMVIDNQGDLKFSQYPSTRDDSATTAIANVLYTDTDGNLLSAPASAISGGSSETVTTLVDNTDGTYTYTSEDATETIVNTTELEPWYSINGTLIDLTDDVPSTSNTEDVYHLGNVAVGTLPAPFLAFTVGTDPGEDVAFLRFEQDNSLQEDVDLDFIRGYGTNANPAPVTDADLRLGGVRFRTVLNVDPAAVVASPISAFAPSAEIAAETDGVPSLTSAPGRLVFQTTPVGSLNTQTRMVIDNQGNVGIGEQNPDEKLVVNGKIKATDVNFSGLPVYADEAAATAGGLATGDMYRTATGELRIKL